MVTVTASKNQEEIFDKSSSSNGAVLTSVEKRSIFLLLIGTFLEYFDLVLYVHLAVVLNPLFFPTKDPWTAGLLGALTFSTAYLFRPIGAFVFGYIGDKKGRKTSIVWTSGLMGLTALTIACLPTHNSIGFVASVLFILARALQGFASIGEIVGAQVFVVEIAAKSRFAHFLSTLMVVALVTGGLVALGLGMLCLSFDPLNGWRWPFLFGTLVAFVGGIIRLKVLESPAFIAAHKKKMEPTKQEVVSFMRLLAIREKNYWCYFAIEMTTPLALYFAMRYCADLLRGLGLSATEVIGHNFVVSVFYLFAVLFCGWLSLYRDPLAILKGRLLAGFCLTPLLLATLSFFPNEGAIFVVQALMLGLLSAGPTPAQFPIVSSFPIIGRCTNVGSAYAVSHAIMYAVVSTLIFFLDQAFGLWGVGSLFMMTILTSLVGASRFTTAVK